MHLGHYGDRLAKVSEKRIFIRYFVQAWLNEKAKGSQHTNVIFLNKLEGNVAVLSLIWQDD